MAWTIELSDSARRDLSKLDRQAAIRIRNFLRDRVATSDDPRAVGKATSGPLAGYWRYRVGDYRVVCEIQDVRVTVFVIRIGDRKDVYR
ncbi:MAG: type II toxin-antitoxin system RelE/ParE family toxin [Methylocystis sp.]|nr:type II toxin-antitoxin system RelE/ParE family toxin [Methylocystis sp.]MCA3583451.1 type II toxin-antitoxin system RelE/ParE family toxin [Methylocystis sp.]MCA3587413.1 type II toxin-antitoxin system RelE/ParE family toxin [Methylocystis sp.]MCA3592746.1 type II toxin-antitoxin system RelE/ParE family toxin [Methylocystis sp.]